MAYNEQLAKKVRARANLINKPIDITGRPMKNFVFVEQKGWKTNEQIDYWIDLAIKFNPLAKSSKTRQKNP